jgi:hypothetical protein
MRAPDGATGVRRRHSGHDRRRPRHLRAAPLVRPPPQRSRRRLVCRRGGGDLAKVRGRLREAGAVWGGGGPRSAASSSRARDNLGGCARRIAPKALRITGDVREGDAIVALASAGVPPTGSPSAGPSPERLPPVMPRASRRRPRRALLDPSASTRASSLPARRGASSPSPRHRPRLAETHALMSHSSIAPRCERRIPVLMEAGPIAHRGVRHLQRGCRFAVYVREGDAECLRLARPPATAPGAPVPCWEGRKAVEIEPSGWSTTRTLRLR